MKKFIVSFLIVFSLINGGLFANAVMNQSAFAAFPDFGEEITEGDHAPMDYSGDTVSPADDSSGDQSGHLWLPPSSKYTGLPAPAPGKSGQDVAKDAIFSAVKYAKVLTSVLAVLFIIFMGVKYVTSGGDEEAIKKSTQGLLFSLLALALISMSNELAEIVGFYDPNAAFGGVSDGGILNKDNLIDRVTLFDRRVEIIMTFIKYFVAGLAVLMLITNGLKLVVGGGEEENIKKARNGVAYSLGGLILLYFGNTFVTKVFYKVDKTVISTTGVEPQLDLDRGVEEIVGVTNFIVSFVGPLLMLLILVGGVMYLTSAGEEEKMNKAKRLIISAVIGVVVIYGAFAIVSTVTTGYFAEPATLQEYDYITN